MKKRIENVAFNIRGITYETDEEESADKDKEIDLFFSGVSDDEVIDDYKENDPTDNNLQKFAV